ncbi:MAG TPA: guanitoxin biosynthesis heme-dependent pre-guanitoxin N-hydroxylase GntA [Chitinophagaceae bacterium]|nr:guanitoxin biosynthesis heme-dependent pre-guanitoxin N-hydroxylase GntA [Chitinophagaceae bacterium]
MEHADQLMEENISNDNEIIVDDFKAFVNNEEFPCVAAKAALSKDQIKFFVADHMACPKDDQSILSFLYNFIDQYRLSETQFHSACVIFKNPFPVNEKMFDQLLWMRLQVLSDLDALKYDHDKRVSSDPSSPDFSFSLKEEAFYVIGISPASSRNARHFKYPALVFNAHAQFEQLRSLNRYEKMKNIVRKKEMEFSGSINPMLEDFGKSSEVHQYSGMQHDSSWKCPLNFT